MISLAIIIAAVASFLVGASKGGLPMVSLLAVPLLATVVPASLAAGMLLPIYIVSDAYGLIIYRHHYSKWNLQILIPAAILGIVLGFLSVNFVQERLITLAVALIGIFYLASDILRKSQSAKIPPKSWGWFWGALSGIASYISHAGGPPFQAYVLPQRLEKLVFAGTSTIFFAVVNMVKFPFYAWNSQFAALDLKLFALLLPFALLGVWLGYKLVRILPEKKFFMIVRIMLFVVSLKLLFDVFA